LRLGAKFEHRQSIQTPVPVPLQAPWAEAAPRDPGIAAGVPPLNQPKSGRTRHEGHSRGRCVPGTNPHRFPVAHPGAAPDSKQLESRSGVQLSTQGHRQTDTNPKGLSPRLGPSGPPFPFRGWGVIVVGLWASLQGKPDLNIVGPEDLHAALGAGGRSSQSCFRSP
jgi:hypothetical protein